MARNRTLTVSPIGPQPLPLGMRWLPLEGEQARGVLDRSPLGSAARGRTLASAIDILGRGMPPNGGLGSETGLVVGYVQSGKTLSFTTVIGLARDNNFPLVIVIAGTKTSLLTQSTERLADDLDVNGGDNASPWRTLTNPRAQDAQTIRQTIGDWSDPDLEEDERATLLITVLKQRNHLERLTDLLAGLNLSAVPVLVVDDEADQAGLNTKVRQNDESTTHRWLRRLRAVLPLHTYLQYTATPQAPLLINIMSTLSPAFVHVLAAGPEYVGGKDFFAPGRNYYVKQIPPNEVLVDGIPLPPEPPPSLLAAMRIFFVGLAVTLLRGRARRSMLMHPSRVRAVHRELYRWSMRAIDEWRRTIALPESDPDRQDLLGLFRCAYNDLARTERAMPSFEAVVEKLPRALRRTQVIEFNTNDRPKTPEIEWRNADGWILVGGQAVDRGFTVDSLTVTYMPRGLGMGNADAIQQRARFFGYKRKYVGLCRIYLEGATITAFRNYVEHEEIMRRELEQLAEQGQSLREWKRRFALSPALRPCRNSVIALGDDYIRGRPGGGWTEQRDGVLTPELRVSNDQTIASLVSGLTFEPDGSYLSTQVAQQHEVAQNVPLERLIGMLVDYQVVDARDTAAFTGLLLQFGEILRKRPDATAAVYRMRPNAPMGRRTLDSRGTLENFLQGRTGDGRNAYPGDAFFKSANDVTLQLHRYNLFTGGDVAAQNAPLLAFYIPSRLAINWIVQSQTGQT